ncbi:protein-methionine sulfoxide oxidase mical2b isoform X2 [Simochromis diagramma]|uniref:protein-methionine sulfoxide oxidase mical2b isoform X2 n=1 Tax=Simochromis diagramma TaxID=43689 RepID=UPI001A7EF598|nr:protein-methionine sulfoxide oxidase mical2b isoform X2 [Simochromis diagramma]
MAAVKALQQWCRIQCEGYQDVSITNMTTSFRDGLAFCALIHKHRPDLIKFDSLKKDDVYENNKLAFSVAEEQLGIPALLDAEDMVALKIPDRLSILTYVSQYYNYFHGRSPIGGMAGIKRPADGPSDEPSGKKNQAVTSKVFPSSKPARENSPPPSSNITKPLPSPNQNKTSTQEVVVGKSQAGTLSSTCASCHKHVHLVQRHLVDGKLYHRNCAKLLSSANTSTPLQDLTPNSYVSKFTPLKDSSKHSTPAPTYTSSSLSPSRVSEKPTTPKSTSASPAPWAASSNSLARPTASRDTTTTVTPSINTRPAETPRPSATAAKTLQSKLKFFQEDNTAKVEEKKTSTFNVDINKGQSVGGKAQQATAGKAVTVVINVGGTGKKEVNESLDKGGNTAKTTGTGWKVKQEDESNKSKSSAAAFISKKLSEENNNNNKKQSWATTVVNKTEKSQPKVETPKKEKEGVGGKVKLKVNPSILSDLQFEDTTNSSESPGSQSGLKAKTADRAPSKTGSTLPNTSVKETETPADWRSKLKPVSKETKPAGPSTKPGSNEAPKTSEISARPSSQFPSLSISVTPPTSKGLQEGLKGQTKNGTKSETKKMKPDYIPKEDITKELEEIEQNLNELEKRGVDLEVKLRKCEEEGDDDTLTDELMVEWFGLIRNKQLAMRRESELVYIGRTQELEEEQPTVEQELRRLMEKPEHLKTSWDRKKEQQLMKKLVAIVNDRNAIVEGLDEDRLREEEEDEQLNKMMLDFNIKKEKEKPKKEKSKSPMSKLFGWGNKKES